MVNVKDGKFEVKKRLYNCKLVAISKTVSWWQGQYLVVKDDNENMKHMNYSRWSSSRLQQP